MGQSRTEDILENMLGAENKISDPQSREEALLIAILETISNTDTRSVDPESLGNPQSREEELLLEILKAMEEHSGDSIVYKNYIKFNGKGIMLPWTLDADHKVEIVFHEKKYYNLTAAFGTTKNQARINIISYQDKYYTSTGTGETNFGVWTAGEHTFVANNGNNHCEFDGEEVTPYTPTTDNVPYILGARGSITDKGFQGWIKSFKIYSLASGELLHDLKPARVFDTLDCFYDSVDKKIYYNDTIVSVDDI